MECKQPLQRGPILVLVRTGPVILIRNSVQYGHECINPDFSLVVCPFSKGQTIYVPLVRTSTAR